MVEGISQVQTPSQKHKGEVNKVPTTSPCSKTPPSRTSKFTSGFPAFKMDCSRNDQKLLSFCVFFCQKKPPQWSYPVAARGLLQKYLDPKLPWAHPKKIVWELVPGFTASWKNKKTYLFGIPQWRMELQKKNGWILSSYPREILVG